MSLKSEVKVPVNFEFYSFQFLNNIEGRTIIIILTDWPLQEATMNISWKQKPFIINLLHSVNV